ncbi:OmpA family protein [Limisalsivibrio acetivorans]|uniref:OmpA family protein n=1 Tax=Limisalsivibrio acetivorans TaxID=1304888 RepID=UPI0003B79ADD|nr:OmpA family protein [Limisalsivibrio acetivorans]
MLLLLLLAVIVSSGGADAARDDGRKTYKVHVTKDGSKVVTALKFRAYSTEDARDQASLNGWVILKVEEAEPPPGPFLDDRFKLNKPEQMQESKDSSNDMEGLEPLAPADNGTGDTVSQMPAIDEDNLTEITTLYFNIGEFTAEIPAEVSAELDKLDAEKDYVILGHTDSLAVIGNNGYDTNFSLSRRRADFLKSLLVQRGISSMNISTIGLGTLRPDAENTPEGQRLNRRAELYERR